MLPNNEQLKSLARWVLAWASGIVTGWLSAKGWLTADQLAQVTGFFSSETVVTLVVSFGTAAIAVVSGLMAHTRTYAVGVVAAMPGTSVSSTGSTITIEKPVLAKAAAAAATPAGG